MKERLADHGKRPSIELFAGSICSRIAFQNLRVMSSERLNGLAVLWNYILSIVVNHKSMLFRTYLGSDDVLRGKGCTTLFPSLRKFNAKRQERSKRSHLHVRADSEVGPIAQLFRHHQPPLIGPAFGLTAECHLRTALAQPN